MIMSRMDEKGQNKMTPLHYAARSVFLFVGLTVCSLVCQFLILRYGKVDKEVGRFTFREDAKEKPRRVNDMVNISSLNSSLLYFQDTLR